MENLRQLLRQECDYVLSDSTLDEFLGAATLKRLHRSEILVEVGAVADSMYIVKEGILRLTDMNGNRERTFAFGLPGTVFVSKHSFVRQLPSYYQIEACCDSVVLCIPRRAYDSLIASNHDFTRWMLVMSQTELFYQEYKNSSVNNGSAAERFESLLRLRPEIPMNVSGRTVASYLGISPEYYCRLKKRFLKH